MTYRACRQLKQHPLHRQELVEVPLRRPELLRKFGSAPARGALLHGPPGCGKTMLARAAAAQCGANFICINGPELLVGLRPPLTQLLTWRAAGGPCILMLRQGGAQPPPASNAQSLLRGGWPEVTAEELRPRRTSG